MAGAAPAQDTGTDRPATGGAPTLADVLERQNLLKRGLDDLRAQTRPATAPAAILPEALDTRGPLSDAEVWRALKQGAAATPSSSTSAGRLIQVLGEDWRLIRRQVILRYSGYVLGGVVALIVLFRLLRGRIMIRGGRSGRTIPRFSLSHRIAHWFLAATFILMAMSGLILLLGRPLLAPLIGRDANAVMASASLQGHNLFGPVFILSLAIMIVRFVKGNFFQRADLAWILKGGGLFGGHASSNHYNFGEKTWYWIVAVVGIGMSTSGMLLLFPWIAADLYWLQSATILHALGAVLMVAFALGHAYVGSIGMEGALDSMLNGDVDANWAREHHDLWYQQVTGQAAGHPGDPGPAGATEGAT